MTATSIGETTYAVRRLTVAVPDVRVFQRAYEQAVPDPPSQRGAGAPETSRLVPDIRAGYPTRSGTFGVLQPTAGAISRAIISSIAAL
jgi:hypothetical protein